MFLVTVVLSAGLLTAQNLRYEPINGKGVKFENQKSMKVNFEVNKSNNDDVATVILRVMNDQGFQLLLDKDHVMYDKFWSGVYSANFAALYDDCEYKIPEDAGPDFFNPSVITNGEGSVEIPEGVYDFGVFLPENGELYLPLWAETYDPANNIYDRPLINDYLFLAGYEYVLKIEIQGMVEFEVEHNASLTEITLPAASENLTNSEDVTVKLLNSGKHNFSNVTLCYKINNEAAVTETYPGTLTPGSEATYTFNTKADFSAGGLYKVEAWVDYEPDMSHWKDKITGFTKKIAPLALPFIDNFDHPTSMLLWTVVDVDNDSWTWEYSTNIPDADGGTGALGVSSPWIWNEPNAGNDYVITDPIIIPEAGTYNISFFTYCNAVLFEEVESLRILYGTSPNYEEMEVLEEYELAHWDWQINVKNFEIATSGNYYFAFHYNTEPQFMYATLYIDKIRIAAGEYVDGPDIMFKKILAPRAACEITNGTIGAEVFNNGTLPITEFTLTYQVENEMPVSETFYVAIDVRESVTVYFQEICNFSEIGEYLITLTAETPGELEEFTNNNIAETTVTVVAPITGLPFERDFASTIDRTDWNPAESDGWDVSNAIGYYYYWAVREEVPLLSRCITLEPDFYRFTYSFSAGYDYWGDILTDDFYVTFGKSGTDPATWQPIKAYYNCFTAERIEDDCSVNITETAEYVFAFYPVRLNGTLRVFSASLDFAPEHDFRINEIVSPLSLARLTPKYHTEGVKNFKAVIENRGKYATEQGKIEIACNGNVAGSENLSFSNLGQVINVNVDATFSSLPLGTVTLTVNASLESGMSKTIESLHIVSDSTFAWDYIDGGFADGIGINGNPCSLGLIYELQKDDNLTSITLGLAELPEEMPEPNTFGLAVYRVNDHLELGDMIFEIEQLRTRGNNEKGITFNVPNIKLSKGKYFFEVRQLDDYNIGLAFDENPDGFFYDNTDNILSKIQGFGHIHIRPNFGNPSVGIVSNSLPASQLVLYPNPSNGLLNVRLEEMNIERVLVYNAFGAIIYTSPSINASSCKINTAGFSSGFYLISVQTETGTINSRFVVK